MNKAHDIAKYLKRNIDLLPTKCVFMLAEALADAVISEAASSELVGWTWVDDYGEKHYSESELSQGIDYTFLYTHPSISKDVESGEE